MAHKKYAEHKCFLMTPDGYEEITYTELCRRRACDPAYAQRKFIPLHGMLLEVPPEEYAAFYRRKNRQRYLERQASIYSILSLNDENSRLVNLSAPDASVEEQIILRLMLEKLRAALSKLTPEEQQLLRDLFYCNRTEREAAELYGVSQPVIHARKQRIFEKIKKIIEN